MKNFFFIFYSLILPILAGTWVMINFFIPESNSTFNTGLGYFATAAVLLFSIKRQWESDLLKSISFVFVGLLIFLSFVIWGENIVIQNSFLSGLGHLLCGLILFLSHRKKLVSTATA